MDDDARFEDVPAGAGRPVRLKAESAEDLAVISSLVQDAVGRAAEIHWAPRTRRLVLLLNRFRWEDKADADRTGRPYERVRAALALENVTAVRARGLDPDSEEVYALLALDFEPAGESDPGGRVVATLAGGGAIAAEVEALDAALADVTQPWPAPSGKAPDHGV